MRKSLISILFLFFFTPSLNSQEIDVANHPEFISDIKILEYWINSQMNYSELPGMSVGIVFDQKLTWSKGFGYSSVEDKICPKNKTVYRLASISKLFTSIAIMKLRDEGKLQLDDPIEKYLPWFSIKNKYKQRIFT